MGEACGITWPTKSKEKINYYNFYGFEFVLFLILYYVFYVDSDLNLKTFTTYSEQRTFYIFCFVQITKLETKLTPKNQKTKINTTINYLKLKLSNGA